MSKENALINLVGISKKFEGTTALEKIDLYINKREFLTLLGPSGAASHAIIFLILPLRIISCLSLINTLHCPRLL